MTTDKKPVAPVDLYNPKNDSTVLQDARSNKVAVLSRFLTGQPNSILDIGPGGGQELQALLQKFPDARVLAVDNSDNSLARVNEISSETPSTKLEVIKADIAELPIDDEEIDGIIASHVLHEVFSKSGLQGWTRAVQEMLRVLKRGGVIFVRDFSAPVYKELKVGYLTKDAAEFAKYFMTQSKVAKVTDNETNILEMLLHFKTFASDAAKGITQIGDKRWSELHEAYLPRLISPTRATPQKEYIDKFIYAANQTNEVYRLVNVYFDFLDRPATNQMLEAHFKLSEKSGKHSSAELVEGCTKKMQLVFRKVPRR